MMNKKIWLFIGIALIGGILIGRLMSGGNDSPRTENTESAASRTWTCSMHPQIRQPAPGDCPICGMDLIPLSTETDEGDPMDMSMSKTAMMLAKVQTSLVGEGEGEQSIRLNGKVEIDDREVASSVAHVAGRIEQLLVNFEGEEVRRGQLIARVYSPELVTAQRELLEAEKFKDVQPGIFEASKERLRNWKLTDKQIDGILNDQTPMNDFPIYSERSGTVTERKVERGDYVKQGQPLFEVTDLSKLWILFDVYEQDMHAVKKGSEVAFTIASIPGEDFKGKIDFIDPLIDSKTRVAKARVTIKNANGSLKPEMLVSGIVKGKKSDANLLTVPRSAVLWTGERSVVYVSTGSADEHTFRMREITLGPAMGDSYAIVYGLEAGERVVTNGAFHIDAAAQLAGKPSMMDPEGGSTMLGHDHGGGASPLPASVQSEKGGFLAISTAAKAELQPMINDYLSMKDALVSDDFATAKGHGENLKVALEQVDMKLFKGDAHEKWMDVSAALTKSVEYMAHFSDIEQLRTSLRPISEQMVILAKTFDPMDETIYVEFCPMADDNKGGTWLSLEEEIRNPYFGESMFKCGKVVEVVE